MPLLVIVAVLALVAVVAARVISARTRPAAPLRPRSMVPGEVDRSSLARPEAPWMVLVFSSATCGACRGTWEKVRLLESDEVAVADLDSVRDAELHDRYGVDAVPMVLVLDAAGTVRHHVLGEPSTADLWAEVARLRDEPPSADEG